MAETETKIETTQPMEIEKKVEKPEEKAPEVPEKSSKKSKKSRKEKKSRKNRSRSRSDSESTGESKSKERKASRSKSKSRSRSSTRKSHRRKKEKRTKKHRRSHSSSRSASSRSRSKSHSPRRRKHRRDNSYERRRRDRHDDRHRNRRNEREHRPARDRRRRSGSRSRSPHPLLRGAVASNQESSVRNKIEDANKNKMFWDGFQWVAKLNTAGGNVDPAVLAQTKKMRRLVISNLPLNLGIGENEVGDFVTKFIVENYLNDEGNYHPVKEVSIDTAKNSATIELSSVEETNKLAKVEAIKILGSNCRVAKVGDPKLNSTVGNLMTDAQYSGQAAAAALTALTMLSNKEANTSFTLSKVNVLGATSKILKVTNLVDPENAKNIADDELAEIHEDISGEFGTAGKVVDSFIVKKEKAVSGAETGTVFLTFEDNSGAEKAYNSMANKRYENRDIRVIYVDEETYKKSFAHLKA